MTFAKCTFAFVLDVDQKWSCPPHHHYCTEIVFCDGCSGIFYFGKNHKEYRPGDVLVCQPGETHWVKNTGVGRQVCFGMDGAGAETIPIGIYSVNEDLAQLRSMLFKAIDAATPTNSVRVDLLCGLAAASIQNGLGEDTAVASKTERVKEIIDAQYVDEWDTTMLAHEVGLSPDYLRQVFRAKHGISVARYLREVRLKTAARLLESTADSIRQIAGVTGFDDSSYFSKVFRRQFGQSPGEYRASRKLDPDPAMRLDEAHPHE